ncbi:hypothetical protein [Enterococcus faecalis]|uniref:hypothetical protein n=1 Tax=Enterococcus faecalis TaxID=1351 RepID=UPI001FF0BD32|nr:hypothetical protein [Enterococcus faecalis]
MYEIDQSNKEKRKGRKEYKGSNLVAKKSESGRVNLWCCSFRIVFGWCNQSQRHGGKRGPPVKPDRGITKRGKTE